MQTGLYVLDGVAGLYLLGFGLLYLDGEMLDSRFTSQLPVPVIVACRVIYFPLAILLHSLGFI